MKKYKNLFNIEARKFHFRNRRYVFISGNIRKALLVGDEFIQFFLAVLPPLPSIFSALLEDSAKVSF